MPGIIGEVRVEPADAVPGQTVTIEVLDADGRPLDERGDVAVYIDGIVGARRKTQFAAGGERTIRVRAVGPDGDDMQTRTVRVAGEPLTFLPPGASGRQTQPALLHVQQLGDNPYGVRLSVGDHPRRGRQAVSPAPRRRHPFLRDDPGSGGILDAPEGSLGALVASAADRAGIALSSQPIAALQPGGLLTRIGGTREPRPAGGATRTRRRALRSEALTAVFPGLDVLSDLGIPDAPPLVWDFGDGTTASTRSLQVEHDFSRALEPDQEVLSFDITCRLADSKEVARTLTLHSVYGILRRRGVLSPPVASTIHAAKSGSGFSGQLTASNIEHEPITITHRSITPLTDDADALHVPQMTRLRQPIEIPARSDVTIGTYAAFGSTLPYDAAGFEVRFAGTSASGAPVRFGAVFDIPLALRWWAPAHKRPDGGFVDITDAPVFEWPWDRVTDVVSRLVEEPELDRVSATVQPDDDSIVAIGPLHEMRCRDGAERRAVRRVIDAGVALDLETVGRSALDGTLLRPPLHPRTRVGLHLLPLDFGSATMTARSLDGPPAPGPVVEGQVCDPDNLSEDQQAQADDAQLVCQLTDEEVEALMPARFMNARKGDIILSPGGPGLVGALLRRVHPAQRYSHSGIMTRNYDEVTHSTASERRLKDYLVGFTSDGSDGIRPDVLKWMWPGVVAQPVQAAIDGEPWVDPDNGKTYQISSFSPHAVGVSDNDDFQIVPPLVIKPDPMLETPEVRAKLHGIAAEARAMAARPDTPIKSHYRLFCYTDPSIALTDTAPPEAGWAAGTFPSVCSSFIWHMAKRREATLESPNANVMPGELEPDDVAEGAEVLPTTLDGLYRYTAAERLAAGQWLYDKLYDEAHEAAGWFGVLLTDAADDLASQVVNTFAADLPDKDSDVWQSTLDANAVSPDNLLWWDGPDTGGLYGYAEPLIYREPRVETYTISRWRKVISRSDVTGRVTQDGQPVPGAFVQAYEGKATMTGPDGRYRIDDVPIGTYKFKAWKVVDGIYHSVERAVTLSAEAEVVDLALEPPEDRYRLAKVFLDFDGRDDEDFTSDEVTNPGPEYRELELGPDRLTNATSRTYRWGGEVRAEYTIELALLADNSLQVQVRCLLFEGTSEDTSDLDGQGVVSFNVPMDSTGATVLKVTNTQEDEPDTFGRLAVTIENARNTN